MAFRKSGCRGLRRFGRDDRRPAKGNKKQIEEFIWKTDYLRKQLPKLVQFDYSNDVANLCQELIPLIKKIEEVIKKEINDSMISTIKYGIFGLRRCFHDLEESVRLRWSVNLMREKLIYLAAFCLKFLVDIHYLNQPLIIIEKELQQNDWDEDNLADIEMFQEEESELDEEI